MLFKRKARRSAQIQEEKSVYPVLHVAESLTVSKSLWDMDDSKNFRPRLSRLGSPMAWTGVGRPQKPVNRVEHNSLSCAHV